MKRYTIEQKLSASRHEDTNDNEKFIARTMRAMGKAGASATFEKVMRTKNVTKKELIIMKLRQFKKRLIQMPRYGAALFILGVTGTVGATAYVTYKWINPQVTITNIQQNNDDDRKQYTIDRQCGEFYSGKELKYELSRSSSLTDEDVYKVFKNTCAYHALSAFIESRWQRDGEGPDAKEGDTATSYQYSNLFAGSTNANSIFGITIGRVTGISSSSVTLELTLYSVANSAGFNPEENPGKLPYDYYPEGKVFSRTLPLSSSVEVWADGELVKLSDVNIGDQVQAVTRTQNKLKYYEDIKMLSLGEQITFDVVGLIKTDIDTRYVSIGGNSQIGDPKIVNTIAGLDPCHNNPEHLCVFAPNQLLGPVYSTREEFAQNQKYLRADAADNKKVKKVKYYELDGRIIKIEGTRITIEARGKKTLFTVDLPYDAVAEYNKPKPIVTPYDQSTSLKIEVGDMAKVYYSQLETEDHLVIKPGDLEMLAVLEQAQPDGTLTKY